MRGNLAWGATRHGLAVLVLVAIGATQVQAAPWVSPGDSGLRRDIELLAAYGIIDGPVTVWPIPWAQISAGLDTLENRAYPPHVEQAMARLRSHMPRASTYRTVGVEGYAGVTNDERLVRGFDGGAREDGDVSLSLDKHFSTTYLKLSIGWRDSQVGNDLHFDDSYIAQAWGNWVFHAGTLPQWWGGGYDGGTLISTNARPFPRIGLQRLNPKPFETPWLSWLGNWNLHFSTGKLSDDRNDFDNPIVFQLKFTFSPVQGLDIGLNRAMMVCGDGRDACTAENIAKSFVGVGGFDNTGTFSEPGNQLGGIDIRYGTHFGPIDFAAFAEMVAEDFNDGVPDKNAIDIGFTLGGYWASQQLDLQFRFEASDTEGNNLFGLEVSKRSVSESGSAPGSTFNNFIFTDGFTFRQRTIGHPLDTDSRLITLEGTARDRHDRSYWLRYRYAKINVTDLARPNRPLGNNLLSANRESINIVEAGTIWPLGIADLRGEVRLMDDQPNTPGRDDFKAQVEASLRFRF